MAVTIPTDIIEGVMRAAAPKSHAEAARRLSAPTTIHRSASPEFAQLERAPAGAAAVSRPLTTSNAMMQFEAFVLQCFIEPMLPSAEGVYGGGTAGGFWKSMLAEKLAVEMAKGGGIGIAKYLQGDDSLAMSANVASIAWPIPRS